MLSGVYCRVGKPQQLLTRVKPWLPFFSPFLKLQLDQAQARAYFSAVHNRGFPCTGPSSEQMTGTEGPDEVHATQGSCIVR